MKKLYFTLFLLAYLSSMNATNYYVSQILGNDSNNGLSHETPFFSLQKAHDATIPGDIVFVMNGVYTKMDNESDVLQISISGNQNQWITYKNYENHQPIIQLGENNWQGIGVSGADYIIIDGFTIIGNNDQITLEYALSEQFNLDNPSTSGNGIGITIDEFIDIDRSHHVIIKNCKISKCGGGGIYTYQSDYITIENNVVFDCAWYSPYNNSGISMYQNWNSDQTVEIKNYIIGNTCFRNENYVPRTFEGITAIADGNGIVIDDSRNTQFDSPLGVYLGKTYVANNVVFDNGARGIHCYSSDNVVVANNTLYKNCQSPSIQNGELTAIEASNIVFANNIVFPDNNVPPIENFSASNLVVENNLWAVNAELASPYGENTVVGNPDFVFESSNFNEADFELLSTSVAINAGTLTYAPLLDKNGNARVGLVDIGAYEFQTILNNLNFVKSNFTLYPNPANDYINLTFSEQISDSFQVYIYNSLGQKMNFTRIDTSENSMKISVNELSVGMYFVTIINNGKLVESKKFLKK